MDVKDFYYDLPQELIAQDPLEDRSSSRLMVLDKATGEVEHRHFKDIVDYLRPGDCLVINNTKVIPARLYGVKEGTEAKIEILLLKRKENDVWETLVKPGKKCKIGTRINFGEGLLTGEVIDIVEEGNRLIQFHYEGIFEEILDQLGQMPLPPYIDRPDEDADRELYQTVYSEKPGAVAAPTAGLHFDEPLLEKLRAKGVEMAFVTLHVGAGTFQPVRVDTIEDHIMHSEYAEVPQDVVDAVLAAKARGNRVIAVGTTSVRSLESAAQAAKNDLIEPLFDDTQIFIYPGFQYKVVDALVTNFHLPESTLIMLVSAFAGYQHTMNAYKAAVEEKYRFFSYGDAMFITYNPQAINERVGE